MPVSKDTVVTIRSDGDIVSARQQGRSLAAAIGFSATDATLIATAISELARNIVTMRSRASDDPQSRNLSGGYRHRRSRPRAGHPTSRTCCAMAIRHPAAWASDCPASRLMDEFAMNRSRGGNNGHGQKWQVKRWVSNGAPPPPRPGETVPVTGIGQVRCERNDLCRYRRFGAWQSAAAASRSRSDAAAVCR